MPIQSVLAWGDESCRLSDYLDYLHERLTPLVVAREATEITASCWEAQDADAACSFFPPAPSTDIHQAKGGGCYDNTAADGEDVGEWEGNLYNYNHFFWGGGVLHEVAAGCCVEWDHASPEARCCAAGSVKINSTPLNTKTIIVLMWHWEMGGGGGSSGGGGGLFFGGSNSSHLLWLTAAAAFYQITE